MWSAQSDLCRNGLNRDVSSLLAPRQVSSNERAVKLH
jgi:hypothetical protein